MLPSFPSLPTDNLYKFMALTGFFIYLICLGFMTFDNYDWGVKRARVESLVERMKENKIEAEEVQTRSQGLFDRLEKNASELSEREMITTKNEFDKTNELLLEIESLGNEVEELLIPMRAQEKSIIYKEALRGKNFGFWLGFIGFALWYLMVQRHQDKVLRNNTLKSELELEKATLELSKLKTQ